MLAVFETGVRYQMYHALALFAVAWGHARWQGKWFPARRLAVHRGHPDFQRQPLPARADRVSDG